MKSKVVEERPVVASDARPAVLEVEDLAVEFPGDNGTVRAATDIRFSVPSGGTLGVVGESGCGKSVTLRALCGLVPEPGRMVRGRVLLEGQSYESAAQLASLRGEKLSMIFQDPASTLNPVRTIGSHLTEVLRVKLGYSRRAATAEAVELLDHVGIPNARRRMSAYPHEFSGGMRQRVMIAMAIACRPRVLLADEPTTALDVTTQLQILELMMRLQRESGMAIVFVSHDLGVIEEVCEEVVVMYAGYVVERGPVDRLVGAPMHPYTRALIGAIPHIDGSELPNAIGGSPPNLDQLPPGCPFAPRCPEVRPGCESLDMHDASQAACACPFSGAGLKAATAQRPGRADERGLR